ncbi:8-amino-7-oxononanoate synthase [Thalassorhabdus alkalitolerans]|uniref:8-amino-7-oxononanoate synthase n=1 Tax=Thalassorhabdus alkalitolerans TaxID=2282697 RepID=A0ABW0YKF4_9BACI
MRQRTKSPLYQTINNELEDIAKQSLTRSLVSHKPLEKGWIRRNGKLMLNFSSNDYLGLAGHPEVKQGALQAIHDYGASASSSRLIVGSHPLYEETEQAITSWKQRDSALIVHNGYTANVGAISALASRNAVVYSDKLNHASIIDGIVLSRAKKRRYNHNDMNHLESLLKKDKDIENKIIITDSLFSMDGDFAPLEDIVTLKKHYGAFLIVDEAHSSGIYGPFGRGYSYQQKVDEEIDLFVGTCGKALGSFGAYVVADQIVIQYLVNKMRSFIFSTGLPPSVLGAIQASITLVQKDEERRRNLLQKSKLVRSILTEAGFNTCLSDSHIVPILTGDNETTLTFSSLLMEEGISAVAIRPPTVPPGEARIRLSTMAVHSDEDLISACQVIKRIGKELGVIT